MRWRTIVVGNRAWRYHVGRVNVVARSLSTKLVDRLNVVTGRSWDVLERGHWKRTSDGMVTPKNIAAWITRALEGTRGDAK